MCGECNMFDVTRTLELLMICGVLSCASIPPARGIVALIDTHRWLFQSPLTPIFSIATLDAGFFTAFGKWVCGP